MRYSRFKELRMSRLGMGTAQFGMRYGINNTSGQTSYSEIVAIFERAIESGVNVVDTAPAYRQSEEKIGKALQELGAAGRFVICTKLDLPSAVENLSDTEVLTHVRESLAASLERLKLPAVSFLLLHRPEDRTFRGGLIWDLLKEQVAEGTIGHLGVSVGGLDAAEAIDCLTDQSVEALQIPFNAFDSRWDTAGVFARARERGVAVFSRSAYLQGLLVMPLESVPASLAEARRFKDSLDRIAREEGIGVKELALRYVLSRDEIHSTIVGVDSESQFLENRAIHDAGPLTGRIMQRIAASFPDVPRKVLVPFLWDKEPPP